MPHSLIVFLAPLSLGLALAMAVLLSAVAIFRQVALARAALILLVCGAILLAIAAGGPVWNRPTAGTIAVMVDLSPSTRGATFRDWSALDRRIHQLLGDRPYQIFGFSDHNQALAPQPQLPDLPCDRTIYDPPPADAVLLFSDGRFELLPYAPPTYPVIDPAMDDPPDAAVTRLSVVGNRVLATVTNSSTTRPILWSGAVPDPMPPTSRDFTQFATPTGGAEIKAALAPGDRWPENDSLSLMIPPPAVADQWWVGAGSPPGWQSKTDLPSDPADYLLPGVIVLNNIPADSLSSDQQRHLLQYVRDLGGALVIVGGDHAFAAGGYDGSLLEVLSPLASSPPQPAMHWMLLADGSGSMEGEPWKTEAAAMAGLLPQLPPNDLLSVGSFARSLDWWSHDQSVSAAAKESLPPAQVVPNGPTNLAAALAQIAQQSDGAAPSQLLLMTDADADLPQPAELAAAMKARRIRLYLLALGRGSALPALRSIAQTTGGFVVEQGNPQEWSRSANQLLRAALPDRYQHQTVALIPGPGSVADWNRTWLKEGAIFIQRSTVVPMIARWPVGSGSVAAIAYAADANTVQSLAQQIAQQPADSRFDVTWDAGPVLRVTVNALDRGEYLNGQSLTLELQDAHALDSASSSMAIPQTGPGLYELTVPAPRLAQFATVKEGSHVLRRFAVAGCYPPEFDLIGNDRVNLKALADRTGGSVIEAGPAGPIDFHWPVRQTDLTSEFAIAGFAVISMGLVANRRARR